MLQGIHPLLTGELLLHLDAMGHSDSVVVADAHFPAAALGARVVVLPGSSTPEVLAAIRTVIPLDLDVQRELMDAAGTTPTTTRFIDRFAYYDAARAAFLIVRTGETRKYGNALLRKGVVGHESVGAM